jgi:hypothetical protein
MGSFTKKYISATFSLASGTFANGNNVVTVTGLRMSANIVKAGGSSKGETHLRIFGMSESIANQLSTLGMAPNQVQKNGLLIQAGDNPQSLSSVFEGTIANAFPNFQAMPNVSFEVLAYEGLYLAVKPVPAITYPGAADAGQIMQMLAQQMNLNFENHGVQGVMLTKQYLPGSGWDQIRRVAEAAGIVAAIDGGTLAIWPPGGSRGNTVTQISPETGMVGYPGFNSIGLEVMTLFNAGIMFGGKVQVHSSLARTGGIWTVHSLSHELDCEMPNGKWFTRLLCVSPGYLVTQ